MTGASAFEPARYLSQLSGKDYLEVKWRLVWLRDRHPDATVDTELVEMTDEKAVFKAVVEIPGGGRASGYGSETQRDFRDFLEKAETKAIGRALAALGFGTQFCNDHDFGSADGRVVDAPVQKPSRPQPRDGAPALARPVAAEEDDEPPIATQEQFDDIAALMRALRMPTPHQKNLANKLIGREVGPGLLSAQAEALIEELQKRQDADVQPMAREKGG